MPMDQFASLVTLLPEIEATLIEKGETIPRPVYGRMSDLVYESDRDQDGCSGDSKDIVSRKNIDATSEEDEETM